jgi:nuclear RNA export factor
LRSGGRGNYVSDRAKQNIIRGLGGKQAKVLESRITDGGVRLQVSGLSDSKAASNPDGGLDALLSFLERKASGLDSKSNRAVKIKKVCSVS